MEDKVTKVRHYQDEKARLEEELKRKERSLSLKPQKSKKKPVKKQKRLRNGEKLVERVLVHLNRENDADIFEYALKVGGRHKIEGDPTSGKWWKAALRLLIGIDDYVEKRRDELAGQRQRIDEEWASWRFKNEVK